MAADRRISDLWCVFVTGTGLITVKTMETWNGDLLLKGKT